MTDDLIRKEAKRILKAGKEYLKRENGHRLQTDDREIVDMISYMIAEAIDHERKS